MSRTFIMLHFAGRDIGAIYATDMAALLPAFLEAFSKGSRRRNIVARIIKILVRIGLHATVVRRSKVLITPSVDSAVEAWFYRMDSKLGVCDLRPLFIYPPQGIERGRIYIYHIAADRTIAAFTKLSLNDENDKKLQNEAHILELLATNNCTLIALPKLIAIQNVAGHVSITTEALPTAMRPICALERDAYESARRFYAGRPRKMAIPTLLGEPWAASYLPKIASRNPIFYEEVMGSHDVVLEVTRAHGDPGPANFQRGNGQIWLMDWEDSHERVPSVADCLGLELGRDRRKLADRPDIYLQAVLKRYGAGVSREMRLAIMLSLIFRASMGQPDAAKLIDVWRGYLE